MANKVIRSRRGMLLFKVEDTLTGGEGVDALPIAADDAILVEAPQITFDQSLVTTTEMTGSLDPEAPIVGGLKVPLAFDVYLKGSGTPELPPNWASVMECCGWQRVETGVAVPAAPQLAAAGSATTLTLGAGASATAQAYRGMPIDLYRDSANPLIDFITNYTAGKVASLAESYSPVLGGTVEYQIPKNVLWKPTSDDALIKSGTAYLYMDGVLYKVLGCRGTLSLTMQAGQPGKFRFELTGMYGGKSDAAVPSTPAFDATRSPIWRDPSNDGSGHFSIGRAEAALRQLVLTNGNTQTNPDNPNAAEGFDPSIITGRRMTGTMDPLATLVATRNAMDDFRTGQDRIVHARIGTVPGNRFGITIPAAFYESYGHGDREGLQSEELGFFASGRDAGAFICQY
ncbi:hypothetical protein EDC65_2243 [Stella humosa]|uniref:Uncharacterized protein n=1 Tax=Stella humosa TaxID=94 RepID=A0A3N1LYZ6_9PROT|nr:phage tail tube protein [Stella humosa]ROQ00444.1 hypothetical protein EDC65_2243 [Stella humosa]BBK30311.1 hypothetical protein STHU_09450 [Stella humosa]